MDKGAHISKIGNRRSKTLLYICAESARLHNKEIKLYYDDADAYFVGFVLLLSLFGYVVVLQYHIFLCHIAEPGGFGAERTDGERCNTFFARFVYIQFICS